MLLNGLRQPVECGVRVDRRVGLIALVAHQIPLLVALAEVTFCVRSTAHSRVANIAAARQVLALAVAPTASHNARRDQMIDSSGERSTPDA